MKILGGGPAIPFIAYLLVQINDNKEIEWLVVMRGEKAMEYVCFSKAITFKVFGQIQKKKNGIEAAIKDITKGMFMSFVIIEHVYDTSASAPPPSLIFRRLQLLKYLGDFNKKERY